MTFEDDTPRYWINQYKEELAAMERIKQNFDFIRSTYLKVIEDIQGIDKKELKLGASLEIGFAGMTMVDPLIYETTKKIVRSPELYVGIYFLDLSKEEQEGVLAHEIGHYKLCKDLTLEEIAILVDKLEKWRTDLHIPEELEQWHLKGELSADEETAKADYGRSMLTFLKNLNSGRHGSLFHRSVEELPTRIANLEKVLGEKRKLT